MVPKERPCYGCPDRHMNCHGNCKKEAEYLASKKDEMDQARKRIAGDGDVTSFLVNGIYRRRRKNNRPGVK